MNNNYYKKENRCGYKVHNNYFLNLLLSFINYVANDTSLDQIIFDEIQKF